MKNRSLLCNVCCETGEHQAEKADVPTSVGLVSVVFACLKCGAHQPVTQVTKAEYFDLPAEGPLRFKCEGCEKVADHSVASVRLKWSRTRSLVVLHCKDCNYEVRQTFEVGQVPQQIMDSAQTIPEATPASA